MNEHKKSSDLTEMEARLRALPQLTVPPDLESKLLDGIPHKVGRSAPGRPVFWRRIVPATAVAAGILLLIVSLPSHRQAPGPGRSTAADSDSPEYVIGHATIDDPKETDPCYILPPQSDRR